RVEEKMLAWVRDSIAKKSALAMKKSCSGPSVARRRPATWAALSSPGRVSSSRKLRISRPSTLLNARRNWPDISRTERSRGRRGSSPQLGQKAVARVRPQDGQVHFFRLRPPRPFLPQKGEAGEPTPHRLA